MTREAWQIDFTDKDGSLRSVVHLHNAIGDYRAIDPNAVVTRLTEPERVQIPAESEHVAHDDWFCEQHPWEVMGHDGCDGAGMPDCARWPMAEHIIRMRDQEIRELHQQYGFLAEKALAEAGGTDRQTEEVMKVAARECKAEFVPVASAAEPQAAAPYNRCPTCTAHMPVGKTCGGVNCGLRRTE